MRDYDTVATELAAAKQQYDQTYDTLSTAQAKEQADNVANLQQELTDVITNGAKACPRCNEVPHGMLVSAGTIEQGGQSPPIFEIGCLGCQPDRKQMKTTVLITKWVARGYSPATAVNAWNAGKWLTVTAPLPVSSNLEASNG